MKTMNKYTLVVLFEYKYYTYDNFGFLDILKNNHFIILCIST